jgi:hypothetical protein
MELGIFAGVFQRTSLEFFLRLSVVVLRNGTEASVPDVTFFSISSW